MDGTNTRTNRIAFFIIVIFVVLLITLVVYLYLNRGKLTTQKTTAASVGIVSITKDGFIPATIQVKKGNQVTWTNNDTTAHRIVSDPHPLHNKLKELDSGTIAQGESLTFTFEKTGTFTYHDETDPLNMKGTVIVK